MENQTDDLWMLPAPPATQVDERTGRPAAATRPPAPAAPQFAWSPPSPHMEPEAAWGAPVVQPDVMTVPPAPAPSAAFAAPVAPMPFHDTASVMSMPTDEAHTMSRAQRRAAKRTGLPIWVTAVAVSLTALLFGGGFGAFGLVERNRANENARERTALEMRAKEMSAELEDLRTECSTAVSSSDEARKAWASYVESLARFFQDLGNDALDERLQADANASKTARESLEDALAKKNFSGCAKLIGASS